ncbi:MAG: heme ABC exporter ATP-binding protein CcmA [Alphaproteobacteria bacterium]|nr:heme ABC exporter ATP-binding protein CcmA [Alphaproteobacteria bacterium]
MLVAQQLGLDRGLMPIFRGLDFSLPPGAILHVKGNNGSGKTSLLRGLAGFLPFRSGALRWRDSVYIPKLGAEFTQDASALTAPRLAWIGCEENVKPDLTLREHLQFFAALAEREAILTPYDALHRLGLGQFADEQAGILSHGQKKRLILARLLLTAADLWLLDEPFNGLDSQSLAEFSAIMVEFLQKGGMIILASHQTVPLPQQQILDMSRFSALNHATSDLPAQFNLETNLETNLEKKWAASVAAAHLKPPRDLTWKDFG